PNHEYEILFYIMTGLWAVTASLTGKFEKRHFESFFHAIAPCVKSIIFMAFIMATLIFALQLFFFSRMQIFGFLVLFAGLEMLLWFLYYYYGKESVADVESSQEVRSIMRQEYLSAKLSEEERKRILFESISARMRDAYFHDRPKVFDFFNRALNLSEVIRVETMILDTAESMNFNLVSLAHTRLMINLHRINDVRWVNRYFLQAHGILADGGYLAGKAETIDDLRKRFEKKYPKYFREVLYLLYFIWARVLPKLDTTKQVYFNITKGKNRAISRTEILGRLCFCGFKIIAEEYIDDEFYFIAQKVKTPSMDENPSYGPLVRFERLGQNGKLIYTHKFRTMYPYSEYLQEYVHYLNQLQEGGKFKDDFRVTSYGKIMRKLWIDELPMLYNWVKGDLQLVGIRPLSRHYLNLYTPELQALRKKVKPGLVPPFYADMPKTLEDIMASEERYIKAYLERRFVTQWRYFWKSFYNIFFKNARSA
ncbi:MAG: sugar transferase, partial [Smithella sp.]|nr:sugar transferase [Smithella sp.]